MVSTQSSDNSVECEIITRAIPNNIVFDVEGTLVASVPAQLQCWHEVLIEAGYNVPTHVLQRYSGMDGCDMLLRLLPPVEAKEREKLIARQGRRYKAAYLHKVLPVPEASDAIEKLNELGCRIALATDCDREELAYYREILGADSCIDAVACGEEVEKGKPGSSLLRLALSKLDASTPSLMVGDTPYDALAACALNIDCAGVLTGGFPRQDLIAAGCCATFTNVGALPDWRPE